MSSTDSHCGILPKAEPRTPISPVIFKRLREETRDHHTALEDRLPLMRPELTMDSYRHLLERFFGFYQPLEDEISPGLEEAGVFYQDSLKTPSLEKDLTVLSGGADLDNLPRCGKLPDLSSPARKLGCLYVIEGATLGGQIITRQLHAHLGLTPETGCAFFSGYGTETGPRWKAFGVKLTAASERLQQDEIIIAAANDTFRTLADWLFDEA